MNEWILFLPICSQRIELNKDMSCCFQHFSPRNKKKKTHGQAICFRCKNICVCVCNVYSSIFCSSFHLENKLFTLLKFHISAHCQMWRTKIKMNIHLHKPFLSVGTRTQLKLKVHKSIGIKRSILSPVRAWKDSLFCVTQIKTCVQLVNKNLCQWF